VPTPPTITGARGTGNVLQSNRYPDIKPTVLELQPEETPFVILADKLPSRATGNPEFSWFEDDLEPRFDTINNVGGYASGATSIVVTNGSYYAQHDIVYVPRTGESFRVTAVATNTLTVVRGVGSTAAAVNQGEELLITGSAQPEGDTSKPARSGVATKVTNYTQIFREPWELTETWAASRNWANPVDWSRQSRKKAIEHRKEIEYALLVGHPSEDLTGSQPRRTTGGARHFITTNVTDAGGTMAEAAFWSALRPAFRYGSKNKLAIGAARPIQIVNQYALNKIQVHQGDTTYGLKVMQYISPFGTLNMVVDYLMEGSTLGNEILILDMDQLSYRYLSGNGISRDTHVVDNIQAPDADTRKAELLTEAGMEFGLQATHARITNVTG
jgi:hypothetical protein